MNFVDKALVQCRKPKNFATVAVLVVYFSLIFSPILNANIPANIGDIRGYLHLSQQILEGKGAYGSLAQDFYRYDRHADPTEHETRHTEPPALAALLAPISLLSIRQAEVLLASLAVLAVFISTAWTLRYCQHPWPSSLFLAALSLLCIPSFIVMTLGHPDWLLLPLAVGGVACFEKDKPLLGSVLWGTAAALRFFPLLWLIPLFRNGQRPSFYTAISVFVALTLIPLPFVAGETSMDFFSMSIPQSAIYASSTINFSLITLAIWWQSDLLGLSIAGALLAIFFMAIYVKRFDLTACWLLAAPLSILLCPLAWSYYFILCIPMLAFGARYFTFSRLFDSLLFSLLVLSMLFSPSLAGAWSGLYLKSDMEPLARVAHFAPTLGLIALTIIIFLRGDRCRKLPQGDSESFANG